MSAAARRPWRGITSEIGAKATSAGRYGPPGLIRQPTRLRIDWEDADTLRLQFDAGNQTRLLHFTPQAPRERSLQGDSTANWFRQTQSRGVFAANTPTHGRLAAGSTRRT